jgi:hypothetical protein
MASEGRHPSLKILVQLLYAFETEAALQRRLGREEARHLSSAAITALVAAVA